MMMKAFGQRTGSDFIHLRINPLISLVAHAITNCTGIDFKDNPETEDFIFSEWSHLQKPDALLYTKVLIKAMDKENWFAHVN